jgi:hypothetical protein
MLSPGGYFLLQCGWELEEECRSDLETAGFAKISTYLLRGDDVLFLLAMRPLNEAVLCDGKGMHIPRG